MAKRPIVLGETPLRYDDYSRVREAVAGYNRIIGLGQTPLVQNRKNVADICDGPLRSGEDLDAYAIFLHAGYLYIDDQLEIKTIQKKLGDYIRPTDRGGRGGRLADFYEPIVTELAANGFVKVERQEEKAGVDSDPS